MAQRKPNDDKNRHKEEVAILLPLFRNLVLNIVDNDREWETMEELMEARADIAVRRALDGFGINMEDALRLIRESKDLAPEQETERTIILAAINNVVDFSVAEEYQMADDMAELEETLSEEEIEEMEDEDWFNFFLPIFSKYNDRYMRTENLDIEYSMIVAAYLSALREETTLMYMTMGDERVRPWHLQYEGYTAPKSRFPAWLIPPIEHQCRCFLVEDTSSVMGSINAQAEPEMPDWFNPTFKESVALGGRIFSDEHPYFQIEERHISKLNAIAQRIKGKYLKDGEGR